MLKPNTTNKNATASWVDLPRANPRAGVRLFCFPYAGGNASIYRGWANNLPDFIEVCPVQLPGRDRLHHLPAMTSCETLIPPLREALAPYFDKPFAFFGHSMGATIAFELSRQLRRERGPQPVHLFASGSAAPQLPGRHSRTYDLPEPEFIEELRRLNGTPKEVLEHPELMELLLPTLRADFQVSQTYAYTDEPPLDIPLTAIGGIQDAQIPREDIMSWREQTSAAFVARMLPGYHFFLRTAQQPLLRIITETLLRPAQTRP
jgi:medium-chain acyl-[acyl-carrier-protein] hydrolase